MNRILSKVLDQRKGHYCHALEIGSVYELETVIESLYQEFEEEGKRLQQEARKASANGHSAIAQSLINLMKYNHERMFNFYYDGPDTYKKREDMMRRFR